MRRIPALTTGVALTGLALGLSACSTPTQSPPAPDAPSSVGAVATPQDTSSSEAPDGGAADEAGVDAGTATKQILAGKRQALIHITEDDKDWSASYEGTVAVGSGTDDGARFRIIPAGGGQVLIEALRAREEGGRWCVNADTRKEPVSLGTVRCAENANTLFKITATGEKDEKDRPTHSITNEKFGAVQVKNNGSALYIQEEGDGGTRGTYSFVDRGALQ